jgi:hypothetical protein
MVAAAAAHQPPAPEHTLLRAIGQARCPRGAHLFLVVVHQCAIDVTEAYPRRRHCCSKATYKRTTCKNHGAFADQRVASLALRCTDCVALHRHCEVRLWILSNGCIRSQRDASHTYGFLTLQNFVLKLFEFGLWPVSSRTAQLDLGAGRSVGSHALLMGMRAGVMPALDVCPAALP